MSKTTKEQMEAIEEINRITGIPLLYMEQLAAEEMTAEEVFYANKQQIDDMAADVAAIKFPSSRSD